MLGIRIGADAHELWRWTPRQFGYPRVWSRGGIVDCRFPHPPAAHEPPTKEDLGTTTIQGIEVRGTRYTAVTPIGRIGNDRPLVQVNESWTAPGFGFSLRSMNDDLQSCKTTTEVENLDLSEPPQSAFQPPDGYKIVQDELHQVACPEPGMPWQ